MRIATFAFPCRCKSAPVESKFSLGLRDQLDSDISRKEIVYDDIVDSLADLAFSSRGDEYEAV
jgi:hypothetical protein